MRKQTHKRKTTANWKNTRPTFTKNTRFVTQNSSPVKRKMTQQDWNAMALLGVAAILFNFAFKKVQTRVILTAAGAFWVLFCLFHVFRLLTGLTLGVALSVFSFSKATTLISNPEPDWISIIFLFILFTYGLYLTVSFSKNLIWGHLKKIYEKIVQLKTDNVQKSNNEETSANNTPSHLTSSAELSDIVAELDSHISRIAPEAQNKKRLSIQELKEYAQVLLREIREDVEIANHTPDAESYFCSLNKLIDELLELQNYEKYHIFSGNLPSKNCERILMPENLQSNADKLIDRAINHCAKEVGKERSEDENRAYCKQFISSLYDAFKNANSYWSGNENYPHYTGILFTDENMNRVRHMYEDEESGYRAVLAALSLIMIYDDELLPTAIEMVLKSENATVSMLQRNLQLGYSRAFRLMDKMEEMGIVDSFNGSSSRFILITREQWAQMREHIRFVPSETSHSNVNTEQAIRDEENWRREQLGLSPIEYELQKVDGMEGHAFEEWCADLLKHNGFHSVEVTPGSGDQGVDVIAEKDGLKYAIQCKRYSSDLGNTPIQEVVAGKAFYHCHVGAVMTNRYFTSGAKQLAQVNGILLWDRDVITDMLKSENPS